MIILIYGIGLAVGCSGSSDDRSPKPSDDDNPIGETDSTQTVDPPENVDSTATKEATVFTVIGDVPYDAGERAGLEALIETHNTKAKSDFVVHVGDIKPGAAPCDETVYDDISGLLETFEIPTFIVLGDNEYNDCDNPEDAFALWNKYFLKFHEKWQFEPTVLYQEERPENFAWVQNGILFMGLNLVGGVVHDQAEWDGRLADNADWVEKQFEAQIGNVEAAVLFWHANVTEVDPEKYQLFTERFRTAAATFEKPVLYIQGDAHFWFDDKPWPEQNILRVQIESGAHAVQVTVDPQGEEPFVFDREFLD
ncbi:MAG TPA: metallophosphoesterase [Pricia sp.]|nr:metallophosphoesterase [Pricia sp.]